VLFNVVLEMCINLSKIWVKTITRYVNRTDFLFERLTLIANVGSSIIFLIQS